MLPSLGEPGLRNKRNKPRQHFPGYPKAIQGNQNWELHHRPGRLNDNEWNQIQQQSRTPSSALPSRTHFSSRTSPWLPSSSHIGPRLPPSTCVDPASQWPPRTVIALLLVRSLSLSRAPNLANSPPYSFSQHLLDESHNFEKVNPGLCCTGLQICASGGCVRLYLFKILINFCNSTKILSILSSSGHSVGGTAFNCVAEELKKVTTRVAHVLPVSDDGGSTAEIVRVVGGPAVGDIRSRCLRLSDESTSEAIAVRRLLGHRLPLDASDAKSEWYRIVEGQHFLWNGVSRPYGETIRAFLAYFHNQQVSTAVQRFLDRFYLLSGVLLRKYLLARSSSLLSSDFSNFPICIPALGRSSSVAHRF
ncbi:hypothetical protein MA16_Dca016432 [Dendrobium catenatum]|uniref:Uncharacterized protein n=1 Tax=Dendrobium catenatum TaxID=906689 RepID=A0A2I0VVE1_9ASPA|nr:hypothetical protein MA16_Dca016432 [Dendrobium catenatum]